VDTRRARRILVLALTSLVALQVPVSAQPSAVGAEAGDPIVSAMMSIPATGPSDSCSVAEPRYVRSATPQLVWTVTTSSGQASRPVFEIVDVVTDEVRWQVADTALIPSGSSHSTSVPDRAETRLLDGRTYEWRAGGRDVATGRAGVLSSCRFTVDLVRPGRTTIASLAGPGLTEYPEDFAVSGGGDGLFRVSVDPGSEVSGFKYSFDSDSFTQWIAASADGTADIPFTAATARPGSHSLYAQAVDRAGNVGESRVYRFTLARGPATVQFVDVRSGHQFYREISWLAGRGITTGWVLPDTTREFRPAGLVNRDAMAAFLYRAAGSPSFVAPDVSPFIDVRVEDQFYREIAWLAHTGVSTGWSTPAGAEFRPLAPVARDAMAAFLFRYFDRVLMLVPHDYSPADAAPFVDVPETTQFSREIAWLSETGVAEGWPTDLGPEYRPSTGIAREAMAAFLFRLSL